MISIEKAKQVAENVISKASLPAQVLISGGKNQLARIGRNHIYHNLLSKEYSIKMLVADGDKTGSSSCNRFDGPEMENALKKAEEIAANTAVDPNWQGFLGCSDELTDSEHYDVETTEMSFEKKLEELDRVFIDARQRNVEVAGAFSHGDETLALANCKGLFRYHVCTDASFTLSIMTPDGGTGWSEYHSNKVADIEPSMLYDIALKKALLSNSPKDGLDGEFTVILEPPAVESLMLFLGYLGLGGLPYREGRSFFSGKMGEKLLGDNITIRDDYQAMQTFGAPFDYEGVRKKALTLIDKGRFVTPVLDLNNSNKLNMKSTGHGMPYPNSYGPLPLSLSLAPGDKDIAEMIRTTKRGILVTRFFYDNVIDPSKLSLTGMTRDGTFLIENGEIVCGLKNMRYNDSVPRIFNNIVELSKQTWSLREFGRMSLPAIKVDGFRFTDPNS
jgi:predicted Zn-dependent protease